MMIGCERYNENGNKSFAENKYLKGKKFMQEGCITLLMSQSRNPLYQPPLTWIDFA